MTIEKIYIVEEGGFFYGNAEQWADCFFSNVTDDLVRDFCAKQGLSLHIIEGERINFKELSVEEGNKAILEQIAQAEKMTTNSPKKEGTYRTNHLRSYKVRKSTLEDWYPTREDGTLAVSVYELMDTANSGRGDYLIDKIRICVWGDDDFGMERDVSVEDLTFEEAVAMANNIPEPITVLWLRDHGYINA